MTREEAIKKLREQQNEFNEHCIDYAGINEAYNMAIKSLEAWDKVEADILGLDGYYDDAFWEGIYAVSKIIGKHLAEVKNE